MCGEGRKQAATSAPATKCPSEIPFPKQSCLSLPIWLAGGGERVNQAPAFLGGVFCHTKRVLGASFHGKKH